MSKTDIIQELNDLGSSLANSPKENPYQVPAGYFNEFPEMMLYLVHHKADLTAKEELESISPLLSSIDKRPVYSVPEGYFENLRVPLQAKKSEAKVIPISGKRTWMRYAAAAVITGIIALAAMFVFRTNKIDPDKNPGDWVANNMKKVSAQDIDAFVELTGEELPLSESIASATVKTSEIKEMMKDVSSTEIDQFISETDGYEDTEAETLLN
jgi:hypothetical protein